MITYSPSIFWFRYAVTVTGLSFLIGAGCTHSEMSVDPKASSSTNSGGISPQRLADAVHAVVMADRTVYATHVVSNLQEQNAPVMPSEYWDSEDHKVPLPAQMFRMGAELVNKNPDIGFTYGLKSKWPLNRQNRPGTDVEEKGLEYVAEHVGENFYADEVIEGKKYLVAVYPDKAVTQACWDCHNTHAERGDDYPVFKEGDVMGGVIVRVVVP